MKKKCKFCGRATSEIRVDGAVEKWVCRTCGAIYFKDPAKQPRCPMCDEKAWKVSNTPAGLFFTHRIIFRSAEDIEEEGHQSPFNFPNSKTFQKANPKWGAKD